MPKKKQKILVIDDSPIALQWATAVLVEAGYEVVALDAPTGSSIQTVKEQPDLVLVDVEMPVLQGDDVVKMLKGHVLLHNAAVILYSDIDPEELARLARESRADGYIPKTGNHELFLAKIRAFISRRLATS